MEQAPPFVGRAREQAALHAHLRAAAAGAGRLVLLGGEAGAGKTALVHRVIADAGPPIAVFGRCPGPGETPPFGPWLEAVARLRNTPGWDTGVLPPPFGRAPGEWSLYETAGVLGHWLGRHGRPAVIVLEDVHWADAASLDLTRHLAARLAEVPALVVATYRTDELHRRHPLWAFLPEAQRAGAARILLDRLTPGEVEDLVAGCLTTGAASPDVARVIHRRTAGLALFVREMLEWALRTGEVPREGAPLPDTVRQAIDAKLARLSPAAQEILEAAAVVGQGFSSDLLARVAGVPEGALADALEEAVARHVIRPEGPAGDLFAFDHDLVREVLLGHLVGPRRRRWHARVAAALEQGPRPDPGTLALHLCRAGDPRAPEHLVAAGDQALRLGAVAQAQDHYELALRLLPDAHPGRAEALLKLGWCLRWADPARAGACWQEAAEAAPAAGDRAAALWARYMLARLAVDRNDPRCLDETAAVLAAQEALLSDPRYQRLEADLFGRHPGYPRAGALRVMALAKRGGLDEARALFEALSARAAPGSSHELLSAGMALALLSGRLAEAAAWCGQAADTALALGDYRDAVRLRANQLLTLLIGPAEPPDAVDAVAAALRRVEAEARDRAGFGYLPGGFSLTGVYQYLRGDWRGAWHNVVECARQDPGAFGGTLAWYAGWMLLNSGDPAGARPFLEAVLPVRPEDPVPVSNNLMVLVHAQRAELYVALGAPDEARAWLEAAERWPVLPSAPFFRANLRLAWAHWHRRAGDLDAAWRAAAEGLLDAGAAASSYVALRAHRLLGELAGARGDPATARTHFHAAIELAERCRFPFEGALARLARGRALAESPDAPADVQAACAFFAGAGAAPALRAARDALAAVGFPKAARLPDGLTAREAEVIALVAQGLTDREIAARLFISPKTVDRHLRNIFNKLGVANRAALAAYAARQGLAG